MNKTGKEIKINDFKNYNIIFGSINNKQPKTIYINISAWAEPIYNNYEINYTLIINNLHKKIKQLLFNSFNSDLDYIDKFFNDKVIIDLDIRESGIKLGKKSFMSCEITLFLKTEIDITSEKTKNILNKLTDFLITKSFEDNNYFKFYKTKK